MTSGERKEAFSAYLFILPFILSMIFIVGGPIIAALVLSFCKWDIFTPAQFVGLDNYEKIFLDRNGALYCSGNSDESTSEGYNHLSDSFLSSFGYRIECSGGCFMEMDF